MLGVPGGGFILKVHHDKSRLQVQDEIETVETGYSNYFSISMSCCVVVCDLTTLRPGESLILNNISVDSHKSPMAN